jgi:hypothetical protein
MDQYYAIEKPQFYLMLLQILLLNIIILHIPNIISLTSLFLMEEVDQRFGTLLSFRSLISTV